jgi:hypothetical protein
MIAFFFFIFFVYGGVHVYAFLRARSALGFGPVAAAALALFMLVMVVALFLVRALEQHEYEASARALAYLAFFWMAALFIFFSGSLVMDIAGYGLRVAGWIAQKDFARYVPSARSSFAISLGLSLIVCAYGYFEALDIRLERVRIETAKLPAEVDRITIVQITDVHLGLIVRSGRLARMLEVVRAAGPDIFLSTGDLVDAEINHLPGLAEQLRGITAKYGKYAITGNHEYYAGLARALAFTRDAGFRVLRNEAVPAGPITIAGIDDRTAAQFGSEKPVDEKKLLEKLPQDRFTLFLKHQPRREPSSVGLYDLQLSGHTHKGQIFPFTLLVRLTFPQLAGDYDLGKGSRLHVSRGTGTWGPPIRFFAPPEVTVIELVRKVN